MLSKRMLDVSLPLCPAGCKILPFLRPRRSSLPLLLLMALMVTLSCADREQQPAPSEANVLQSLGLKTPSDSTDLRSAKWLVRFSRQPAPQRLRLLELQLGCVFVEYLDGGWMVLARTDFDAKLLQLRDLADLHVVSVSRRPRVATIQLRLLHHLQRRASLSARGRPDWDGGRGDSHVLLVQQVSALRSLAFHPRPSSLRAAMRRPPASCSIHTFELDRAGHASISVTGMWTCVQYVVSKAIAHPLVVAVDLQPRVVLHNRNSSIILANAENSESLVISDTSWLSDVGLDGSGEVIGLADSGIDWDHCAFSPDSGHPPPLNTFNVSRKKIIAYFAAEQPSAADFARACTLRCGSGDLSDDVEGHGTSSLARFVLFHLFLL
jgi:hypothetical protein